MWTRAGRAGVLSLGVVLGLLLLLALAAVPAAAAEPDPSPTPEPVAGHTAEPSPSPTAEPTPSPTAEPTPDPTPTPTPDPTPTPTPDPTPTPAPTPTPTPQPQAYSMNLYKSAGYVRQYNGAWCTAAATQMMGNFYRLQFSSTAWIDKWFARQYEIIRYAKRHDTLARSAGTDPAGWAAALRYFNRVPAYQWRMYVDYNTALRHAVERLRLTGRPVGLLAWQGRHAWVLHGFTATADPATTSQYTITSLRVTGPLAGVDPKNGWISPSYLKVRWGRYNERDGYAGWVGKFVLISA